MRVICSTCGGKNAEHLVFCQECGQRLGPRVAAPTPPIGLSPAGQIPQAYAPQPLPAPQMPMANPASPAQPPLDDAPPQATVPLGNALAPQAGARPQAPDFRFIARAQVSPTAGDSPAIPSPPQATGRAPSGDATMRCVMCGVTNQRGLRFCVTCGHPLAGAARTFDPATSAIPAMSGAAPLAPPLPTVPIAPSRVVDLGTPVATPLTPPPRPCARCRGVCDANAIFCKYCGAPLDAAPSLTAPFAPLGAPVAPLPPPRLPPRSARPLDKTDVDLLPPSAAPETPPVDPNQYRPYQAQAAHVPALSHASVPSSGPATSRMAAPATGTQATSRLVVIARDGGEGPSYPFGNLADIGRTEGDILVAEDRYISPRHARITRRPDGTVWVRDLASVNGIYLRIASGSDASGASAAGGASAAPQAARPPTMAISNDAATRRASVLPPDGFGGGGSSSPFGLTGGVPLVDQDLFLVGQQVLRFEVVRDAEEGFGSASEHGTLMFGTPLSPRYARLSQRTVEGVTRDVFYIRKVETVLGRESGDIVFTDDPFLSRRHAIVRFERATDGAQKGAFTLTDVGSSNGTFLQIREEVRLKDGDHFRIGQQLFRIDYDSGALSVGGP